MKLKLMLYFSFLILLTGCPLESDNVTEVIPDVKMTLLKREVISFYNGKPLQYNLNYDGNKLISVIAENDPKGNMYVTYAGDFIKQIDWKRGSDLLQSHIFTYDNTGRLIVLENIGFSFPNLRTKSFFTHNSDGTISFEYKYYFSSSFDKSGKMYLDSSNEVCKIEEFKGGKLVTITYTHDNKNGLFKNVLGFDKINFAVDDHFEDQSHKYSVIHSYPVSSNVVKVSGHDQGSGIDTRDYTYNSDNFPVNSVNTNGYGQVSRSEYFYNR